MTVLAEPVYYISCNLPPPPFCDMRSPREEHLRGQYLPGIMIPRSAGRAWEIVGHKSGRSVGVNEHLK